MYLYPKQIPMSKILNPLAIKAIYRMGDLMIPKNGEFPAYSEVKGLDYIDDLLAYAPQGDIGDLNLVLILISLMPTFVLKLLIKKMSQSHETESAGLWVILRQLDFGIRGIVFATYYTEKTSPSFKGKKPIDTIGYSITRL